MGLPRHEGRDGCDGVGLLHRVGVHREVGGVAPEDGHVGAVEGHDVGHPGDLPRQQRGRRVGDRVVDVEEVQALLLGDLEHPRSQGDGVGRVLEEGVLDDRHEVDVDVVVVHILYRNRPLVGYEMDLVPPISEFETQPGGEDAAPADGRIAGYPDSHPEDP